MNRLFLILISLFFVFELNAQYKVKEKSRKEVPSWLNGTERDFLIISATAPTVEEAKEKILVLLRSQVVKAVATNVMSKSVIKTEQANENENYAYSEQMQTWIVTRAGNIPFIKSISLSKADDYYWEKLYDKQKKTYCYEFHIKYKFLSKELEQMVREFNDRENELNVRLKKYQSRLENVESVEEIDQMISELKGLSAEFSQEDSRKAQTDRLMNDYLSLYSHIRLEEVENGDHHMVAALYRGDKQMRTDKSPLVRSNCATKFKIRQQQDGTFRIGYDDFNCYDDDENYIEIRFLFGTDTVSKKCYINKARRKENNE